MSGAETAPRRWRLRALRPGELDFELIWSGVFFLGVGVALAMPQFLLDRLFCPFKALTGVPCATCGTTRSMTALLHFDGLAALQLNPMATLFAVAWALFAVYGAVVVLFRLPRIRREGFRLRRRWLAFGMGLAALNWAYLIAAGV